MSEPANTRHPGTVVFIAIGIAVAILAKKMFFDLDGLEGIVAAGVAGGIGAAAGGAIGALIFKPKGPNP